MTARLRPGAVLLGVIAVHLVLGGIWLLQRVAVAPAPPSAMMLRAFAAPAVAPPLAPATAPLVASAPTEAIKRHNAALPDVPMLAPTAAVAVPCAPLDTLQAALAADSAARSAIAAVPLSARSVAEAIVVWNVGWSEVAGTPTAPLAIVRDVVTRTLATMPAHCLAEPVVGPRLILIDNGTQTSVLAFGSGTWRWSDLSTPSQIAHDENNFPAAAYLSHRAS